MKVILVSSGRDLTSVVSFLLASQFHARVRTCEKAEELIVLLSEKKRFDLIICSDKEKNRPIFEYLKANASTMPWIPCILIKDAKQKPVLEYKESLLGSVDRAVILEQLARIIGEGLSNGRIKSDQDPSEYCKIRTELLMMLRPIRCDIFIRLSELRYSKIFQSGDQFTENDLEIYLVRKKTPYVYVKKTDAHKMLDQFETGFSEILKRDLQAEDVAGKALEAHEAVHELTSTLGFTPEVQRVAKQAVELCIKSVSMRPNLIKLMKFLKRDGGGYISSHSLYLAHMVCCVSANMDWQSGTTFQKLTFAAFFHDITLSNPELAKIMSIKELDVNKEKFTPAELEAYKKHSELAAELLKRFNEMPLDVSNVIFQHHEEPDGTGFPKGTTGIYISPLSALFIVTHAFVHYTFNKGGEIDVHGFVDANRERFSTANFKKVLDALVKTDLEQKTDKRVA